MWSFLAVILLGVDEIVPVVAVNVVVGGTLTDKNLFQCGEKASMNCTFPSLPSLMTWQQSSNVLTNCYDGANDDCSVTSVGNKKFSSILSQKLFIMEFDTVEFEDSGEQFKCLDSSGEQSHTVSVVVVPESVSATITTSKSEGKVELKSGCAYPFQKVSVAWTFYKKTAASDTAVTFPDTAVVTTDNSSCAAGVCGGAGVAEKVSTITVKNSSAAEEYYFVATITHADAQNLKFTMTSDPIPYSPDCGCVCECPLETGDITFTVVVYIFIGACIGVGVLILVKGCFTQFIQIVVLVSSCVGGCFLKIGFTIYLHLDKCLCVCPDDCQDDGDCDECEGWSVRIGLVVGSWLCWLVLLILVIYFCSKVLEWRIPCQDRVTVLCGGSEPAPRSQGVNRKAAPRSNDEHKNPKHLGADASKKAPRPQPPLPEQHREPSGSVVSREDVQLQNVAKRDKHLAVPSTNGGMGKRGLSANFDDHEGSDITPLGNRSPRLQPIEGSFAKDHKNPLPDIGSKHH